MLSSMALTPRIVPTIQLTHCRIRSEEHEPGLKVYNSHSINLGLVRFDIKRDASYLKSNYDYVSYGHFPIPRIVTRLTASRS